MNVQVPGVDEKAARIVRVAAAQFRTGKDADRVLAQMLHLIDEAAAGDADLVHFQETCNYPTSYDSREHAWQEAITIPGPMIDAISARARQHGIHVSFNAAVRGEFPVAWMVNHLIGPDGSYIGGNKKQVLMWIERDAFSPSDEENQVFDTAIGRIGLISCMDGLVPETTRTLACQGADIVLNSLCSNGLDEAHFHIPARSAENGIFMIAANRIGDMVTGADLDRLISESGMDRKTVQGAGESQITGPRGEVIARATRDGFGLTYADIDLGDVQRDTRLSGRRPDLYGLISVDNDALAAGLIGRPDADNARVLVLSPEGDSFAARLESAVGAIRAQASDIAVLPELFAWSGDNLAPSAELAGQIEQAVAALVDLARATGSHVAAGIPEIVGDAVVNRAILFGPAGVIGQYRAAHFDAALGWSAPGDDFPTFDLPFGRVALLLGEDLLYPEAGRVLARKGVDLIACCATWRSDWQVELMLPERSAENHVTIAAAARSDSPFAHPGMIVTTASVYRFPQTMEVNNPDRHVATGSEPLAVTINLAPNRDKRLMFSTDLIMDTRPALYDRLVAQPGLIGHNTRKVPA
jgi:predicted amidohydrolase